MPDNTGHRTPTGQKAPQHARASLQECIQENVVFHQEKSSTWRIGMLIGIALVPLLFCVIMMLSVLDPATNMSNVPVVVVNQDKGAMIDDKERNVGVELCDKLVDSSSQPSAGTVTGFSWVFLTSVQEAEQGLKDGTYYIEVVIPEGFSQAIAQAGQVGSQSANLMVQYNPLLSYNVATIGQNFIAEVANNLTCSVQSDKLSNIYINLKQASTELNAVTNTSKDLSEGMDEAGSGAKQLAEGATQLADGVAQLADGIKQLKDGIEQSSSSPETLALSSAMSEVGKYLQLFGEEMQKEQPDQELEQSYLDSAAKAASQAAAANAYIGNPLVAYITGGSFSYSSGATTVTSNEKGLIPALQEYNQAQAEYSNFMAQFTPLVEKAQTVYGDMQEFYEELKQFSDEYEKYEQAIANQIQAIQDYQKALQDLQDALAKYTAGQITAEELQAYIDNMQAIAKRLEESDVSELLSKLSTLMEKLSPLMEEIQALGDLSEMISKLPGLIENQAKTGAALSGAAGKVEGYLVGVASATSYTSQSMATLTSAITAIYEAVASDNGSDTLSSGASQLSSGAGQLADGINTAADGSDTLSTNLKDAADQAAKNSQSNTDTLVNPIVTNTQSEWTLTTVSNFGTSMAPYYFAIALWIGCMLASVVLNTLSRRKIAQHIAPWRIALAGYIPLAAISVAQSVVMLAVVQFGLSMNVNFPLAYYAIGIAAALAFSACIQLLCGHFELGGILAAIVVLSLQLALASAIFPVQTVMPALGVISLGLPFTHVVRGLRWAMCGMDGWGCMGSIGVLLLFAMLFLGLTIVIVIIRRAWKAHASRVLETSGVSGRKE